MGNASAFELDALDTRIRELIVYARERDGEDRTLLFRNLVDLFLTGKAPKKQPTRNQLLDVIEALIPHVEPDGRRTVAELVAGMSEPPLDLACRLARDRAHLVGDILKSTAFDEADIIELIQNTGRDHHHVIASRNDLSANIWIALARAAPSATGFDNQSSLALWRDDLGLTEAQDGPQKVTPFRDPHVSPQPSAPETEVLAAPTADTVEHPSAAGPQAAAPDSSKSSKLRILRTDKDLLADRIEPAHLHMQTAASVDLTDEDQPLEVAPVEQSKPGPVASGQTSHQVRERLEDPELGGWRWRSDRDGLVVDISSTAFRVYEPSFTLIGSSILDLLGLNDKLEHPVSRAIQRRSTIHDAPLVIDRTTEANRFWTMEATPVFAANGGMFEGYEGTMTPVQASTGAELPLDPTPETTPPVFQEEKPETRGHGLSGSDTLTDENIDRTKTPAPETKKPIVRQNHEAPAKTPATAVQPTPKQPGQKPKIELPGKEALMAIASDMIQEMVGDSVAKALEDSAPAIEAAVEKAKAEPNQPKADERPMPAISNDVAATIHMLGQALGALEANGETLGNSALRLQTEIATACLKTLKEQLGTVAKPKDDI